MHFQWTICDLTVTRLYEVALNIYRGSYVIFDALTDHIWTIIMNYMEEYYSEVFVCQTWKSRAFAYASAIFVST